MKNLNKLKLKECPECKGAVIEHFDTCPNCGACQSKKCREADADIKEWLKSQPPEKKLLYKNQGYGTISHDENNKSGNSSNGSLGV